MVKIVFLSQKLITVKRTFIGRRTIGKEDTAREKNSEIRLANQKLNYTK